MQVKVPPLEFSYTCSGHPYSERGTWRLSGDKFQSLPAFLDSLRHFVKFARFAGCEAGRGPWNRRRIQRTPEYLLKLVFNLFEIANCLWTLRCPVNRLIRAPPFPRFRGGSRALCASSWSSETRETSERQRPFALVSGHDQSRTPPAVRAVLVFLGLEAGFVSLSLPAIVVHLPPKASRGKLSYLQHSDSSRFFSWTVCDGGLDCRSGKSR